MQEAYARVGALWGEDGRVITEGNLRDGYIAEAIRWCRNRLGGRDEDLVGPLRWAEACDNGWSEQATYSCIPSCRPGKTWQRYTRELAQYVYLMLPARDGSRNYDGHSAARARLELELTALVVGWFDDEARGNKRSFPPLALSRPPDLRAA